jgi:hypothetical protein
MIRALAVKELREAGWVGLAALGAGLCHVAAKAGTRFFSWFPGYERYGSEMPFSGFDDFASLQTLILVLAAIAMGLWQTAWEIQRGTFLYLFHRPLRRSTIMLVKLFTGGTMLLVAGGLPILIYAWWATTRSRYAALFQWSMVLQCVEILLTLTLVYLGAFVSGLNTGRWWGMRLLPLCAMTIPTMLLLNFTHWWLFSLPWLMLWIIWLTSDALWQARIRDY